MLDDCGIMSSVGIEMEGGSHLMEILGKEFDYYLRHQDELVEKYNGKFIVIKGDAVIGVYESEIEAVEETSKHYELGTFLVQKCEPGSESYTYTYHSRVAFV